ncbi:MAG: DUF6089 family protein [Flavobacterium sp.]|nr:DUF6089 family protein [Flavobacterium sp.]
MNRILSTFLCFFMVSLVHSQIHEVGLFAGGANFIGDVGRTNYVYPNAPAIGIVYKWNRSPRHAWRASFTVGELIGKDTDSKSPGREQRGYEFHNTVKELSLGLEFNFFDFDLHQLDRQITPYIYGGLSYFRYDSKYVRNSKTEDAGGNNSLAIPMVVGVKSNITPHLVLGFEVGARYTFEDDLDGSSPSQDKYPGLKFGNTTNKDWYVFSGFTLTYTFGNSPCYCQD